MQALPWHGTHRDRRVALEELHRVEPLGDRGLQLLVRDVHAQAGELLAVAGADLRRQDDGVLLGRGLGAEPLDPFVGVRRSEPERHPRLEPREPALRDRALERASAGDRARGVDVRGQLRRAGTPAPPRRTRARRRSSRAGSSRGPGTPRGRRGRRGSFGPLVARGPDHDLADPAAALGGHDRRARDDREPVDRCARRAAGRRPSRRRPRRGARERSRSPSRSRSAPRRAVPGARGSARPAGRRRRRASRRAGRCSGTPRPARRRRSRTPGAAPGSGRGDRRSRPRSADRRTPRTPASRR